MDDTLRQKAESMIAAMHAECSAAQPNFGVALDAMASSLFNSIERYLVRAADAPITEDELTEFLSGIQSHDLFLAIACSQGSERAWWEFDQEHRGYMERVARHLAKTDVDARDVIDGVYVELYGTRIVDGERVSKFKTYSGRGSLRGWLRTVIWHSLVDLHRASHDEVSLDEMTENVGEGAAHASIAGQQEDNEAAMLGAIEEERYRVSTRKAITNALAQLEPHERLLLLYYHVDGLKLREIATLVEDAGSPLRGWFQRRPRGGGERARTHESTVMRWLEKTYAAISDSFRRSLADEYGYNEDEIEVCIRLAMNDLAGPDVYSQLTGA